MVVVEWIQDGQDDVMEDLEDNFDVVKVVEDDVVLVKALEDDLDVVEFVEDGFGEDDVAQDKIGVAELPEDDVHDEDAEDEVPEEGREAQACIDVLHDVVAVHPNHQDEKVMLGHVHIEAQDVQVEDEDVDKGLDSRRNPG